MPRYRSGTRHRTPRRFNVFSSGGSLSLKSKQAGADIQPLEPHDNFSYHVDMGTLQIHTGTNAQRHSAVAEAWLLSLSSENTRRAYRRDLSQLFAFFDAQTFDALTAERHHIDAWRTTLTDATRETASSTVARKLAAVSSFYSYAADDAGVIAANPVRRVTRPKVDADHSATQGLTKDQARALLYAAQQDGARSYALVSLLILTGIRVSEALSAHLSDLQHDTGHRVLIVTRKGGKRAKIVLPAQVVDALSSYLGTSVAEGSEVAAVDAASADPHIFTTATGKRWMPSEALRTVQRLAGQAGIAGHVTPHSLRHTHATLALDAGVTLRDLQDSMGHADPRTTRRYDRARGKLERSSAHAVAQMLG